MKNAVPRNDKKRRKQLTEDVAKLEAEMEQKHREELDQLKLTSKESKVCEINVSPCLQHRKTVGHFCYTVNYEIVKPEGKKALSHAQASPFIVIFVIRFIW